MCLTLFCTVVCLAWRLFERDLTLFYCTGVCLALSVCTACVGTVSVLYRLVLGTVPTCKVVLALSLYCAGM